MAIAWTLPRLRRLTLLLCLAGLVACDEVGLYSKLTEHEANEMVAALTAQGIDATKERSDGEDWQILVDKGSLSAALEVLRAQGLPSSRYVSMGEVFQKQGLVSTPSEERMRYVYAVSQELSQTLRTVDGVVEARVHVVVPANDPLSDKVLPSSAAVFIKHRPDVDLRLLAPAVKDMVAHSIEGLTHEKVSLSLFEARPVSARGDAGPTRGDGAVFGVLSNRAAAVILVLLLVAAGCVMVLPALLRKHSLDWRTWLQRQVLRR